MHPLRGIHSVVGNIHESYVQLLESTVGQPVERLNRQVAQFPAILLRLEAIH